jgi:hypothetical protein
MMRVEVWDSDSIEKIFLLDGEKLYLILLHLPRWNCLSTNSYWKCFSQGLY